MDGAPELRPSRVRPWMVALPATFVFAICGFVPLMGLPGGLVLACTQPVVDVLLRRTAASPHVLGGDYAWPAAIVMTWAWPACWLPATLVAFEFGRDRFPMWVRWTVFVFVLVAWALVVTFYLEWTQLHPFQPPKT